MSLEGKAITEYASLSGKIHTLVIDKTLSISGAAADAKSVGDKIYPLERCVEDAKAEYQKAIDGIEDAAAEAADKAVDDAMGAILSNPTKAMYGMSNSALPDDVFAYLSEYSQHWWKRKSLVYQTKWKKTEADFPSVYTDYVWITTRNAGVIYYSDSVAFDENTGTVSLVNPAVHDGNSLKGKYIQSLDGTICSATETKGPAITDILYMPTNASLYASTANQDVYHAYGFKVVTSEPYYVDIGEWGLVHSPNSNAYPHGGQDADGNFEYEYIGIPFDNAVTAPKIETGSYTGTGTYGANSPNSLTFSFKPRVVIFTGLYRRDQSIAYAPFYSSTPSYCYIMQPMWAMSTQYVHGKGFGAAKDANARPYGKISADGKTVYWYQESSADLQYNATVFEYYYVAIG